MSKIDPGPGYRLLRTGERLKDGDEYFDMGLWRQTGNPGCLAGKAGFTCDYRRKVEPGPGFRLLEEGEIIPSIYEWLDDAGEWRKHGTRAGVLYSRKSYGFCRTDADVAPYRPEAMTILERDATGLAVPVDTGIQPLKPPIPGSPEDKASLAELDSLIPAPKAVDIVAPWPEAVEPAKIPEWVREPAKILVSPDHEWIPKPFTPNKYTRDLLALDGRKVPVDVYSVLAAFPVGNAAVDHALKKLLAPGQRGQKDRLQDLKEARASLDRAIQMEGG